MPNEYLRIVSEHSWIDYVGPDRLHAEVTADVIQDAIASLVTYMALDRPFPTIHAILAPDRNAFDSLIADVLRVEIERPSDPRRIAQPQRTDVVFLSPSVYATQSAYEYVPMDYRRMVHHEMVHVVQEYLSPNIETSPFWWDEGLAVYLSEQWQYESQFRFREPVIAAEQEKCIPSLADIERDPALAYAFGWTLVRFIEQQCGRETVRRGIRQMADGDVFAAIRQARNCFERDWQAWLLRGEATRALSPATDPA